MRTERGSLVEVGYRQCSDRFEPSMVPLLICCVSLAGSQSTWLISLPGFWYLWHPGIGVKRSTSSMCSHVLCDPAITQELHIHWRCGQKGVRWSRSVIVSVQLFLFISHKRTLFSIRKADATDKQRNHGRFKAIGTLTPSMVPLLICCVSLPDRE
jgi:hypothetical protein